MKVFSAIFMFLACANTAFAAAPKVYGPGVTFSTRSSGESDDARRQRLVRERDAAEREPAASQPKYETQQQRYARLREQQRSTPAYLYDATHNRVRWVGPRSSSR